MMTKNEITVIDQELIDWFENWLSDTEVNELLEIDEKTIELLDLAKDLIEINAELTKREQKCLAILRGFVNLSADAIRELDSELKGDSDE